MAPRRRRLVPPLTHRLPRTISKSLPTPTVLPAKAGIQIVPSLASLPCPQNYIPLQSSCPSTQDNCEVPTNTYRPSRGGANPDRTWPGKPPLSSELHTFAIFLPVYPGQLRSPYQHLPSFPRRRESRSYLAWQASLVLRITYLCNLLARLPRTIAKSLPTPTVLPAKAGIQVVPGLASLPCPQNYIPLQSSCPSTQDNCEVPTNTYRPSREGGNPGRTWPGKPPLSSELHTFAIFLPRAYRICIPRGQVRPGLLIVPTTLPPP